jgi:bifunctional non-homologous end joining protein LigD
LYLDPNQNDYADTVAAPYSVRPYNHPNVSTPIDWKELNPKLTPESFTMKNMIDRLKKKGDLFQPVLDSKIARKNDKILKTIL